MNPMHPAHHYRIHLWDAEGQRRARGRLRGQERPQLAPGIAHMWHMGGHIFARLGRHADAAWQQEASARVDHAHMMRDWVLPDQIHNFAHNNEWLTRSLRHVGRVRRSGRPGAQHDRAAAAPANTTRSTSAAAAPPTGAGACSETLEQFEQWEALAELADTMYLEPSEEAVDGALRAFALGKAYAHLGDDEGFEEQVEALLKRCSTTQQGRALETLDEHEERRSGPGLRARPTCAHVLEDVLDEYAGELADVRDKLDVARALHGAPCRQRTSRRTSSS